MLYRKRRQKVLAFYYYMVSMKNISGVRPAGLLHDMAVRLM